MPIYDTRCFTCGYESEEMISIREVSDHWRGACEKCKAVDMRRVFRNAPATRIGGEGSDRQINAMRRSYDERFVKSGEMDQVRHKHGEAFDESLVSGAAKRLRNGQKNHWDKD